MKLSSLSVCAFLVGHAYASLLSRRQQDVALLQALRSNDFGGLADALSNYPDVLRAVIASPGKKTLLAPSNAAIANTSDVLIDIPNTLLYHFLNGTLPSTLASSPLHTVLHSFAISPLYADLPGGNGQAVALGAPGQVNEALDASMLSASSFTVGDFDVQPISHTLNLPGTAAYTIASVARRNFITRAASFLPFSLDDMRGATLFVPSNDAFTQFSSQNPTLSHDELNAVVLNHVVQSRAIYSPLFDQGSIITMSGQDLLVAQTEGTSAPFKVTVGTASAVITQTDVMHHGGVIHLIDNVLFDTRYDVIRARQAGDSALNSANSYIYGPISIANAASSQGTDVPPSPAGTSASQQAENSTAGPTYDATKGGQVQLPVNIVSSGPSSTSQGSAMNGAQKHQAASHLLTVLAAVLPCLLVTL